MPGTTLGIGLAGLGQHGIRYARHLLAGDVPRARLVAVSRRDEAAGRAWADSRGLRFYRELADLAADPAVDVLVAVLPPGLHPAAVEAAAAVGKPVLVEKPLAPDADRGRAALEVARRAGIPAMVAQTLRFNSVVRALRELVPTLGRLHLVAINQRFEPSGRPWLDDPDHGGLVLNTGVHGVDLLHHLTGGRVTRASALTRRVVTSRVEDLFAAVLVVEPGSILATLDNSRATGGRSGRIELCGEHGQLVADHVHGQLGEIKGRMYRPLPVEPPVPTVREVLRAFTDAILEDRPVPVPLEEGLAAVEGVDMLRRSATPA